MIWETNDKKGNTYSKVGGNVETKAVVCLNGKNKLFQGKTNISLREGKSKFGKEIVIQFKIDKEEQEYISSSPWQHIELYLNEDIGKRYFLGSINILGGVAPSQKVFCPKCGEFISK